MQKFVKRVPVSALKEGDRVDDLFFVKFKKGFSQYKNGYSFELTLSDQSGKNIEYRYWGNQNEAMVKSLYDSIKADSIVRVQGKISTYNNKLQLATNEPDKIEVLMEGQFNPSDFIQPARKDAGELYSQLLEEIGLVENPKLRELLEKIFKEKDFAEKFKRHPGAIEIHHGRVSGLLEHVLEVVGFCKKACELFPSLDKDLVIAGALLHDIGKIEEIEMTSRIKGTVKGQLLGHISLSVVFVAKKCDEVGLDEQTKNKLLHVLLSHHGRQEFGSPKEPMFPEAVAVYYADELSSKLAEMIEFIERARADTEDDFMYHKRSEKNIFLK
ncbi:MAG: HD domain-containing protein [Candidatus Diapherotrites archaeon]